MALQHLYSQKPIYKKPKEENNLIDLNKVDPSKIMKNDISNNNISTMLRINTNVELRANLKRSINN